MLIHPIDSNWQIGTSEHSPDQHKPTRDEFLYTGVLQHFLIDHHQNPTEPGMCHGVRTTSGMHHEPLPRREVPGLTPVCFLKNYNIKGSLLITPS